MELLPDVLLGGDSGAMSCTFAVGQGYGAEIDTCRVLVGSDVGALGLRRGLKGRRGGCKSERLRVKLWDVARSKVRDEALSLQRHDDRLHLTPRLAALIIRRLEPKSQSSQHKYYTSSKKEQKPKQACAQHREKVRVTLS